MHCLKHHGHHGRGSVFSDTEIATAPMVKGIFKLPLRRLEGFPNSVFALMNIPLQSPIYPCISNEFEEHRN
ncbi:hypothetical protein BTN49_0749 [Candidatus Enterovibrio escicola]|uniref:Transposase DDE domain-containing protein n=1 Tax=Candidatus Enterovibrio escicola TaxID=1927127 RepID=A0A2A5T6Q4_9GAMM|nr:hypothetical protein BTN49_0749 [Candidatus Enterovibrio escacola]